VEGAWRVCVGCVEDVEGVWEGPDQVGPDLGPEALAAQHRPRGRAHRSMLSGSSARASKTRGSRDADPGLRDINLGCRVKVAIPSAPPTRAAKLQTERSRKSRGEA